MLLKAAICTTVAVFESIPGTTGFLKATGKEFHKLGAQMLKAREAIAVLAKGIASLVPSDEDLRAREGREKFKRSSKYEGSPADRVL